MRLSYKRDKKLNQLLMYLAGNYCDSDKSSASPGGGLTRSCKDVTLRVCVIGLCNLGESGIL